MYRVPFFTCLNETIRTKYAIPHLLEKLIVSFDKWNYYIQFGKTEKKVKMFRIRKLIERIKVRRKEVPHKY